MMNKVIQGAVRELDSKYHALADEEIISQIRMGRHSGDALFYLLFGRYAEMLEIIYSKQPQTLIDLDDFMLELDIRLFRDDCRALLKFEPDKASFKTYLSAIARNLLYDVKEKEMPTLDVQSISQDLPANAEVEEVMWLIEEINSFPNRDARYVLLKTIEGYKSKEIALMLTSRRHEEGTLAENESLKPSYIDNVRSRTLTAIRRKISAKSNCYREDSYMPSPSASICFDTCSDYSPKHRRFRAMRTPPQKLSAGSVFIHNILDLYKEMIEK